MSRQRLVSERQIKRLVRAAAAHLDYDVEQSKRSYQVYKGKDDHGRMRWEWSEEIWKEYAPEGAKLAIELRRALEPFARKKT